MTRALVSKGDLTPGQQLFVDAVETLVRHAGRPMDERALIDELLAAMQRYINDPRARIPGNERLVANLGVLGLSLLNRR